LGLMQVMPSTGAPIARRLGIPWRGPQTLFDPHANVRIGVAYLRELIDRYANVRAALAAYHWGPGEIDARLRAGSVLPARHARRAACALDAPGRIPEARARPRRRASSPGAPSPRGFPPSGGRLLNAIWLGLILASVLCAAFTGRMEETKLAAFEGAKSGVSIVI